jgi:hypothetical protein
MLSYCNKAGWEYGSSSKEELIQKTILNITKGNRTELIKLFLSREEHNKLFWPNLPDKFTLDKGITPDSAYDFMTMETNLSLNTLEKQIFGKELKIYNLQCSRNPEVYGPFKLHLGCNFQIKENVDKEDELIRNIYGIIEYNGEFKIYNFKRN